MYNTELVGNRPHLSHSSHFSAFPQFAPAGPFEFWAAQREPRPRLEQHGPERLPRTLRQGRSHLPPQPWPVAQQPTWASVHSQIQHILRPSGGGAARIETKFEGCSMQAISSTEQVNFKLAKIIHLVII